jgi:hypothetical protein
MLDGRVARRRTSLSRKGFPQLAAQYLAGGSSGDGFNEADFARLFVARESVSDEGAKFLIQRV